MNLRRVVVTALALSVAVLALAGCDNSTSVTNPDLGSTPPAAPSNLVGTFNASQQQDYLIWTASSSASVSSYEVWQYADNPAVNSGTLVGTAPAGTSYLALPAPTQNDIELYRIRARSSAGTYSAFSATIQVQRHGATPQGAEEPSDGDPFVNRH